ncbi:Oidioi.mRNA.OKI2018_I69.PAR.g11040.t1.cds [Oikopleura dioica]|uniref:Oidioi.mRNA.OKI2018_I69.PAR.g11040.t1.cds n=1 Tax=Oikopleura dioica TaxID=34765 RepID=A0ABN7RXB2_OIKDI|nr:Oidioi.mRNA.OKI2018_I69.PAR.g11040.t1.cds [Oikopleura dioica]
MLLSPSTWSWSNRSSKEETKFHKGIQHGEVAIVHNDLYSVYNELEKQRAPNGERIKTSESFTQIDPSVLANIC